jgi:rare lipoprotein A
MRGNQVYGGVKLTLMAAVLAQAGCHKSAPAPVISEQTGIASWYGVPFDGRATASGEIFDMHKLTAAHRTLPLGSVVQVASLVNGKNVQVRINDRGPFVEGRIIDLSHAAAQAISMPGVANVSLHVVAKPVTRGIEEYAVQVGSFPTQKEADRLRVTAEAKYGVARIMFRPNDQTWRVLIGKEPSIDNADVLAQKVGHDIGPGFVVLLDAEQ